MRNRPSARILLLDRDGCVLLFRFSFSTGALAGENYWATPGGALEEAETYEQAAYRELLEETGIQAKSLKAVAATREFVMQMPDGEHVLAQERYFTTVVDDRNIAAHGRTELESTVLTEHRWWSLAELRGATQLIYPENLALILTELQNTTAE